MVDNREVIQAIEAAFSDIPPLDRKTALTGFCDPPMCDIVARMCPIEWREITDGFVERYNDVIYFAYSRTFRFFLPVYLRYSVNCTDLNLAAIFTISGLCSVEDNDQMRANVEALSGTEQMAVQLFMRYVAAHPQHYDDLAERAERSLAAYATLNPMD